MPVLAARIAPDVRAAVAWFTRSSETPTCCETVRGDARSRRTRVRERRSVDGEVRDPEVPVEHEIEVVDAPRRRYRGGCCLVLVNVARARNLGRTDQLSCRRAEPNLDRTVLVRRVRNSRCERRVVRAQLGVAELDPAITFG